MFKKCSGHCPSLPLSVAPYTPIKNTQGGQPPPGGPASLPLPLRSHHTGQPLTPHASYHTSTVAQATPEMPRFYTASRPASSKKPLSGCGLTHSSLLSRPSCRLSAQSPQTLMASRRLGLLFSPECPEAGSQLDMHLSLEGPRLPTPQPKSWHQCTSSGDKRNSPRPTQGFTAPEILQVCWAD